MRLACNSKMGRSSSRKLLLRVSFWGMMATVATAADNICSTIANIGIDVESPLSLNYDGNLLHYWSAACSDLKPTCMAAPSSAQEVAAIISALHDTDDLFATKSGGHMPNNGFASIDNGLLILTKNLDDVIYDAQTQTAIMGPGQSWEEAQQKLDGTGRAIVGGRLGGVGVGGYMLGGRSALLHIQITCCVEEKKNRRKYS
jgi:FAD/FMN-containing dehydrogenase